MIVANSILNNVSEAIKKAVLDINLSVKSDVRLLHANVSEDKLSELLLHGSDISKVNKFRVSLGLPKLMTHLNIPTIKSEWDKLTTDNAIVFVLSNNYSEKKASDVDVDLVERVVKTFKGLNVDHLNNDRYTTFYIYKGSKAKKAAEPVVEEPVVEDKKPAKKAAKKSTKKSTKKAAKKPAKK